MFGMGDTEPSCAEIERPIVGYSTHLNVHAQNIERPIAAYGTHLNVHAINLGRPNVA